MLAGLVVAVPVLLLGVGVAPAAAATAYGTPTTLLTGLSDPFGVAVDGNGDLFVAEVGSGAVVELPAGATTPTTLLTGLNEPAGVAVDGNGDLFVSEVGSGAVVELAAGATTPTTLLTGLDHPFAVAVDGNGDLFVAGGSTSGEVVELPAGASTPTMLPFDLIAPGGVAVDGNGDVFVAGSSTDGEVAELPAGASTPTTLLTGLTEPAGVAVDGNGDLFVADYLSGDLIELAAGASTPTTLLSGLTEPAGVAVDGNGDLFVTEQGSGDLIELSPTVGDPTVTGVTCTPAQGVFGTQESCTVSVKDTAASPSVPDGSGSSVAVTVTAPGGTTSSPSCSTLAAAAGSSDTASCTFTFTPSQTGGYTLDAVYTPDSAHQRSDSGQVPLQVAKAKTRLTATPQLWLFAPVFTPRGAAGLFAVSATLTSGGSPVAGRTISFTAAGAGQLCSATTNAAGVASCSIGLLPELQVLLHGCYTATFAGDQDYLGSSGSAPTLFGPLGLAHAAAYHAQQRSAVATATLTSGRVLYATGSTRTERGTTRLQLKFRRHLTAGNYTLTINLPTTTHQRIRKTIKFK